MSIANNRVYRGFTAIFDGNVVNNLGDVRLAANAQQVKLMALGDRGIGFEATESVAPTVGFSTRDAAVMLALANPTSSVDGLEVGTLAKFQFQEKGAGVNHIIASSPRGMLLINDFGCNERDQQALVINGTYHCLSDGTNSPLTFNSAGSLTGVPSAIQGFRLGPVVWQGAVLKGVTNARIQTGFKTSLPPFSQVYPEDLTVDEFDFSLELSGTQLEITAGSVLGANYVMGSPIDVYFQRLPNGGIPTDYATASHIKVRFNQGTVMFDSPRAQGTGNATMQMSVRSIDTTNGRALKPVITLNSTIVLP